MDVHITKRTRCLGWAWLMLVSVAVAGCQSPGFIAYVIGGPRKVKARYTLEERPTLIVVDDPEQLLGDRNNTKVVEANVRFHLIENKALDEELLDTQDHLTVFASESPERYLAMPIDKLGRELDVEQVIHVQVLMVKLKSDNTYYQPTAEIEVKVVDAATGERLFPTGHEELNAGSNRPGASLTIEMEERTLDDARRHAMQMMSRSLAERIGLEVANLFYTHVPPDGTKL